MSRLSVMIIVAISFLFTACLTKATEQKSTGTPAWQVLVKANHSAVSEPRNVVIKSQKELDALWQESQKGIDFGPAKGSVDFSKKWIVAIFLGMVRSAGHEIEIQSIKPGSGATVITLVHKAPGRGCITAQVIEHPFLMAAVDHFVPDKAEFKVATQETPCE